MAPSISLTQVSYTLAGLTSGQPTRLDGRQLLAFRPLHLERGLVAQAAGSARGVLGDSTCCLVVISAEVVQDEEAQGPLLECSVDCAPSIASSSNINNLLLTLQGTLAQALASSSIDTSQLIILRSTQGPDHASVRAWQLHLDVTFTDVSGGNLADVMFATTHAALANVRLPRTRAIGFDVGALQGGADTGRNNLDIFDVRGSLARTRGGQGTKEESAGQHRNSRQLSSRVAGLEVDRRLVGVDFEILSTGEDGFHLEEADHFPLGVTVNLLPNGVLLDATATEEACIPYTRRILVLCDPQTDEIVGTHMLTASLETGATQLGEETRDNAGGATPSQASIRQAIRDGSTYAKDLYRAIEAGRQPIATAA